MVLADVYSEALQRCSDAGLLVSTSNELYNYRVSHDGTCYSDAIHYCVINGAFLDLFKAFEHFLECSFICYMYGQSGLNGNTVVRYVSPLTDEHALGLLKGTSQHTDFTNRDTVLKLSKNVFNGGGPYVALNSISIAFEEMKKIRNAISHISAESQQAFLNLARNKLGSLPPGINTAMLLNSIMAGTTSTFFVYYKGVIEKTINAISNPI